MAENASMTLQDDLTQRLRDIARRRAKTNEHGGSSAQVMTEWLAADEIVRLRDENSRLVEALDSDEFLSLSQERDRLREALEPFAAIPPADVGTAKHYWCVIGNPCMSHFTREDLARARAALNPLPPIEKVEA